MTGRELLQQARDALRDSVDLMTDRWPNDLRQRVPNIFKAIAALDARISQSDWVRVSDALPVIPDDARNVAIWEFGGTYSKARPMRNDYDYEGFWLEDGITHWRYAEPTPQPPEKTP